MDSSFYRCKSEESNLWSLRQHLPHPEKLQETMMAHMVVMWVYVRVVLKVLQCTKCERFSIMNFFEDWRVLMWLDGCAFLVKEFVHAIPIWYWIYLGKIDALPLPLPLLYLNTFSQDNLFYPCMWRPIGVAVWVGEHAPSVFGSGCLGLKNLVCLDGELAKRS